jgi:hypothetical protein
LPALGYAFDLAFRTTSAVQPPRVFRLGAVLAFWF